MKHLVIESGRLKNNIERVKKRAGGSLVYGVLKGGGYGLGLLEMARALRAEGISRFAVTELRDAVSLRENGFVDEEILLLTPTTNREEIETMIDYSVVASVSSYETAVAVNGVAELRKTVIEAHVEIDTGMGRSGFLPSETDKVASIYTYMASLALTGIYTHFYKAFSSEKVTRAQYELFMGLIAGLERAGIDVGLRHACNSAALFRYDFAMLDAVRVGSAFLGRLYGKFTYGLQKVGYIECAVSDVRWLPKGHTVGYSGAYRTKRPVRIAIVPVGYADGYCVAKPRDPARFSETVRFLIRDMKDGLIGKRPAAKICGQRVRLLGHLGMQHAVFDVTKLECSPGDMAKMEANPLFCGNMKRRYE